MRHDIPRLDRARGFSVIELVGVLAVLAVLAVLVTENILARLRLAAQEAERASLATLAGAVEKNLIRTKSIPAVTNLPAVVAADLGVPVQRVLQSAQGNARWFWVDPGHAVGASATNKLPYVQSAAGSAVAPQKLRLLVLASVGTPLPSPAITEPTQQQFDGAWNAVSGGVPPVLASSWNGSPDDLIIQRLEIGSLFKRLILVNLDSARSAPYSIESTNTLTWIPSGERREMWFMSGTVINFHYATNTAQSPGAGPPVLQAREYLLEDASYTFENGRWTRYLHYGPGRQIGWFGEMVDKFLAAPPPPNGTRRYATQQWVVDAMYQFLYCFGQWSLDNFYGGPPWPHIPGYEQAQAGATGLCDYSSDLLIN